MILHNITINIELESHAEWMAWMKNSFIPGMKATGLFTDHKILKLLNEEENNPGVTYSFQFFLKNFTDYEKYQKEYEIGILTTLYKRYQNRFVEFRTVLEVVE